MKTPHESEQAIKDKTISCQHAENGKPHELYFKDFTPLVVLPL